MKSLHTAFGKGTGHLPRHMDRLKGTSYGVCAGCRNLPWRLKVKSRINQSPPYVYLKLSTRMYSILIRPMWPFKLKII